MQHTSLFCMASQEAVALIFPLPHSKRLVVYDCLDCFDQCCMCASHSLFVHGQFGTSAWMFVIRAECDLKTKLTRVYCWIRIEHLAAEDSV